MWLIDPFKLPSKNISFTTKLNRYFYKYKTQNSAGCIVYFLDNKMPKFLQFYVSQDGKTGEWCFPKGIVEEIDKSFEDRALVEVKEEVGLEVNIVAPLKSNTYTFFWDKGRIKFKKTVYYYLAEAVNTNVELAKYSTEQSEKDNFKEFSWSTIDQAILKTNHQTEKDILQEAYTYITKQLLT